ncbi:CBS domain-containing protein [Methanotorris formicicus]|uniref:Putative signal transduction protein with CBS domains n=1 Tax=Methanotorris formicicus Mc-S-70 TaxID=647171 RepID=H1KZ40_9EURY|nr:CBS domain-containing protein [Methanotorris formicicus]EHP86465.1 putative signal transduction protein with CBS domains [Methanotorris formicicus Mc-S-70]
MELTVIQKEILQELIAIYKEKNRAVKGTEIAIRLNRNPGTIRNQMQALRALNLVDGVPGPKGGYVPTSEAYRVLGLEEEEEIIVPIYKGKGKVEGVSVIKIEFDTVTHEKHCSSKIYIRGDTKKFNVGDVLKIGPTYHNKIVIIGRVVGRDDINHILLLDVMGVASVPNLLVGEVGIKKKLYYLKPDDTIKDAAKLLAYNNISGAPVMKGDELVGILSLHDVALALAEGKVTEKVEKIMTKRPITIPANEKIYNALLTMDKHDVGRLIIVDENNKVVGIITRTDILRLIEGVLTPNSIKNFPNIELSKCSL